MRFNFIIEQSAIGLMNIANSVTSMVNKGIFRAKRPTTVLVDFLRSVNHGRPRVELISCE